MLRPCHFMGAFTFIMTQGCSCLHAFGYLDVQSQRTFMALLQNASLWGVFTRLSLSQTNHDNMGVHLAQLSVSVLCYPMGATIGCGLQAAEAFHSPKTHKCV